MFQAYKYLNLEDGLLVIFENVPAADEKIELGWLKIDGKGYINIGKDHLVAVEKDIWEHIRKTKKIYLAESDVFDTRAEIKGAIGLDDFSLGKIAAHMGMP